MKRVYLFLLILTSAQWACSKLDEVPQSFVIADQFYRNEDEAVAAVTAVYRKLYESGQSIYNSLFQIGVEMATDDYEAGPGPGTRTYEPSPD